MKKLVIAVFAVAASFAGHAGVLGVLDMRGGGELKVTDLRGSCQLPMGLAYLKSATGKVTLTGCWTLAQPTRDTVIVNYSDGTTYNYPISDFRADNRRTDLDQIDQLEKSPPAPPADRPPAKGTSGKPAGQLL